MSRKHNSTATEHFTNLIQFRQAAYAHLGTAKDALFELSDAVRGVTRPAGDGIEVLLG